MKERILVWLWNKLFLFIFCPHMLGWIAPLSDIYKLDLEAFYPLNPQDTKSWCQCCCLCENVDRQQDRLFSLWNKGNYHFTCCLCLAITPPHLAPLHLLIIKTLRLCGCYVPLLSLLSLISKAYKHGLKQKHKTVWQADIGQSTMQAQSDLKPFLAPLSWCGEKKVKKEGQSGALAARQSLYVW